MDVWIPYSDVEIPISLPDPIDLRIISRRFSSIDREKRMLRRLNELLVGLDYIKVCDSPLMLPSERIVIKDKLKTLGIDFEFSASEYNVVFNVVRSDPLFGITCSRMHRVVCEKGFENVDVIRSACGEGGFDDGDVFYLDLLVDGLGRLQEVYSEASVEGIKDTYFKYWGGVDYYTSLIIAGLGGYPWDNDMRSIVISIAKSLDLVRDNIVLLVGDGKLGDHDIDYLLGVGDDLVTNLYRDLIMRRLPNISGRIYYYGSLPQRVCGEFGLRYVRDVDKFVKTIPVKVKRETTVIEDVLHVGLLE